MRNLIGNLKVHLVKMSVVVFASLILFANVSCNQKGKRDRGKELALTSLKIDGQTIDIKENMDGGVTSKTSLKVEYDFSPSDAVIVLDPKLDKKNNWELTEFGANTLKITLKKGSETKIYTLKYTRESSEALISLKIGQDTKRAIDKDGVKAGITSAEKMEFAVPLTATEVPVAVELKDGATARWEAFTAGAPEVKDGKITFLQGQVADMELLRPVYKLIVTDKLGTETAYTVQIIKMVTNIIINEETNTRNIATFRFNSRLIDLLKYDGSVELEMSDQKMDLRWYSQTLKWENFIVSVDGSDYDGSVSSLEGFPGYSRFKLPLEQGQTVTVTIKIDNNEMTSEEKDGKIKFIPKTGHLARETFTFKMKRKSGPAYVKPIGLKIGTKEVLKNNPEVRDQMLSENNIPEFIASDPCDVQIQLQTRSTKVTIDGVDVTPGPGPNGQLLEYTKPKLSVSGFKNAPKEVAIEITPEDTNTYKVTKFRFKLIQLETQPIPVSYEINGVPNMRLSPSFQEAVEEGQNPLINIHSKNLYLKLRSDKDIAGVKIGNKEYTGSAIQEVGTAPYARYFVYHTEDISTGQEKEILIQVSPGDSSFARREIKFRVRCDSQTNDKMNPTFKEIAGDDGISKDKEFIGKLTENEESNYPVYQILGAEEKAKMVLALTPYEKDFLLKTLKIDNVPVAEDDFKQKEEGLTPIYYVVEKEIVGINASDKIVKIEFEGKDNVDSTVWNFKIKNGAAKTKIPLSKIDEFSINRLNGKYQIPFPAYFGDHLTDGTLPELEIYGDTATIKCVAVDHATFSRKVTFEVDGATTEVEFDLKGQQAVVEHDIKITGRDSHTVKVTLKPQLSHKYEPLVYSFKLKSLTDEPALDCQFFVEDVMRASGYEQKLNSEYATLQVVAANELMAKVEIGEEGQSLRSCEILKNGSKDVAEGDVKLDLTTKKTYIIKVTPKNSSSYAISICKFKLQGTAVSPDNAEFAFYRDMFPKVGASVAEWEQGIDPLNYDDLGAKKAIINAKTLSPRAKVKYQIVDVVTLQPMPGKSEVILTSDENDVNFKSGLIELYPNQPTKVKMWVESENGTYKDDARGSYYLVFNVAPLWWGYLNTDELEHFKNRGYDEIKIDPSKVKNGKIYIMVAPYNYYTPEGFINKGELGQYQRKYWKAVDVSELVKPDATATEKEVTIEFKLGSKSVFNYKLKIKKN